MAQPQQQPLPFIRIGDTLINLAWVRAIEHADGRLNIFLSEDRAAGLVMRFSGREAQLAWAAVCGTGDVPVIDANHDGAPG